MKFWEERTDRIMKRLQAIVEDEEVLAKVLEVLKSELQS